MKEIYKDKDPYGCCVREIGETTKRIVRNFHLFERDQIKPYGFTITQCYCLLELQKRQALTMNELSELMRLSTSTMTRIVDKLVRDDYVKRSRSEVDRRIVLVSLTNKGTSSAKELDQRITFFYEDVIRNLPPDRIEEVLEAISLLMDAFEKSNPSCC